MGIWSINKINFYSLYTYFLGYYNFDLYNSFIFLDNFCLLTTFCLVNPKAIVSPEIEVTVILHLMIFKSISTTSAFILTISPTIAVLI